MGTSINDQERGTFTDGIDEFSVRTATDVPESLRVYAPERDANEQWVVVLTGLHSGSPKATWCGEWGTFSRTWKARFLEEVFRVLYGCKPSA